MRSARHGPSAARSTRSTPSASCGWRRARKLDPELTEAFIQNIYPFPIGSTVVLSTQELSAVVGYENDDKFQPIVKPIMKKVAKNGKEEVVRLPWTQQQNIAITADSKIQILVNKEIYKLQDDYYQ